MFRQQSMTAAIAADGRMVCLSATGRTDVGQTSTAIIGRGRDMDVVDKVAWALKKAGFSEDWQHANECARAAIAAMLEAVGEPVVWYANWGEDGVRELYDLSLLTQALAAVENP